MRVGAPQNAIMAATTALLANTLLSFITKTALINAFQTPILSQKPPITNPYDTRTTSRIGIITRRHNHQRPTHEDDQSETPSLSNNPRRQFVSNALRTTTVAITTLFSNPRASPSLAENPPPNPSSSSPPPPPPQPTDTRLPLSLLHPIPTFTIVDKRGVPFMVFGSDAKLTAYFFTSYDEADRILRSAAKSAATARSDAIREFRARRREGGVTPVIDAAAEEEEFGSGNPWEGARISSVGLDFAVVLATRRQRGVYFRVAPAETDVEDALALDESGITELDEGKVPLFYIEDMEVEVPSVERKVIPLYFRKSELVAQWKKLNRAKGGSIPEIKVTELFSVINEMALKGDVDEDLRRLYFVPPVDSAQRARECDRKGKGESPFVLGERIVMM